MTNAFELFDHTADLGVRARAESLPELVRQSIEGLYAAIGTLVIDAATPPTSRRIEIRGDDPALLLRDLLDELLYAFEHDRLRTRSVEVLEFSSSRLMVQADFGPLDAQCSALEREVKAVTYHELAVRPIAGGYEAVFIVDI